ncbi:hypothetical protein [Rhodocyclus purpureus]|uniref:hypothetical protein n=1 Tax=Rhodocyclus purpureus TaxID=1067 RepID=UPI0019132A6B|nr:hypothetical protein [Rhodocyclus purpureus]MBK5914305.1 hypothetical protein [Rhodocyclus purpureus]
MKTIKRRMQAMYKAQYKARNAHESWTTIGHYGSEGEALNVAIRKKNNGALMVRVVDKKGNTVYSG